MPSLATWGWCNFLSLVATYRPNHSETCQSALDLILRRKAIAAEAASLQHETVLRGLYPHLEAKLTRLTELRGDIVALTLANPEEVSRIGYQERLADWKAEEEQLDAELARQIPEMSLQQKLQRADRAAVALSLPESAILIEFVHISERPVKPGVFGSDAMWPARYLAFVLPAGEPDNVQMIDLGEAEPIDDLIATFKDRVSNDPRGGETAVPTEVPRPKRVSTGAKLYSALIAPLMPAVGDCKHLLIAPDGDLNLLAFAALPLPEQAAKQLPEPARDTDRYLCDAYRISYLAVGRDALRFKWHSDLPATAPIVCAAPNYSLVAAGTVSGAVSTPTADNVSNRIDTVPGSGRLSHDLKSGDDLFAPLPASRIEGELVAGLLGVERPWLGDEALKKPLKACNSPRILHISTHGHFLPVEPPSPQQRPGLSVMETFGHASLALSGPGTENPLLRSMLAFAGANTALRGGPLPEDADNGILTAEEVSGMNLLATELVVLAACETGLGVVQVGEGVMGLRRAFMLAGARTLVMSLWKVPDLATAILMDRFYRNLLQKKMNRDQALHAAQQHVRTVTVAELRRDWLSDTKIKELVAGGMSQDHLLEWAGSDPETCPFAHPSYWAAFICQGALDPLLI